jgi:putative FmdB family regulatory protein
VPVAGTPGPANVSTQRQEPTVPTYQYSCTECGHFLEAVQKFTDDALTTCPECGGRLRKVFNAVGVVFKGSGFYRTDSRSNGTPPEKKDSEQKVAGNGAGDKSSSSEASGSPAKKEPAGASSAAD